MAPRELEAAQLLARGKTCTLCLFSCRSRAEKRGQANFVQYVVACGLTVECHYSRCDWIYPPTRRIVLFWPFLDVIIAMLLMMTLFLDLLLSSNFGELNSS
jgi:hypothetical protein